MADFPFLRRMLGPSGGARRFAAIAGPHGIHAVEYSRDAEGLALEAAIRQTSPGDDPEALADALADAIEALGGRGGELALGLGGFGSAHHILTLPKADRDVLGAVVRRELLRYYPDLDEPVIDFALGGDADLEASTGQEILVGAIPRNVGIRLSESLRERGIMLRHMTVLPQVLQKLYDTFDGSARSAVVVLVLESGALIGCFHEGSLRLFIEPPQDVHGRPVRDPEAVIEQVERANLFLRQQFPGVSVDRVLLAAAAGEYPALEAALKTELESDVVRLSEVPAGSLAALGAALAASDDAPFQLLPEEVRPRTPAERLTRRLAVVAGALVVAAAVWWAGAGIGVARAEADRARTLESRVMRDRAALTATRNVLEDRRAHQTRLAFLRETASTGDEVRRILAGVSEAATPAVELTTLTVQRADEGWSLALAGFAQSTSSATAVRAIDGLYRGVADRLPVVDAEFGGMEGMASEEGAPVAIGFDMSFIVLWQTDLAR